MLKTKTTRKVVKKKILQIRCRECGIECKDMYCDDCREELFTKCKNCGTPFQINTPSNIVIDLCEKCYSKMTRCSQEYCNDLAVFSNICELCKGFLCELHKNNHTCNTHTPRHITRGYSNKKILGNPNNAKRIKSKRLVGLEFECVNGDPMKIVKDLNRVIGITHDGSLKGKDPIELITPPASADKLEELIDNISASTRKSGYGVNKTCSVHAHFDSGDFKDNPKLIYQLIMTYYAVEPLLLAMLPPSRKKNRYALPLSNWVSESTLAQLKRNLDIGSIAQMWYKTKDWSQIESYENHKWDSSRYYGFNLHSLFMNGHIELRHHHGSLNAYKIKNWVELNLIIINWAVNMYNENIINAIMYAKTPTRKLRMLYRHFPIDIKLRRYIVRGLKKFSTLEES